MAKFNRTRDDVANEAAEEQAQANTEGGEPKVAGPGVPEKTVGTVPNPEPLPVEQAAAPSEPTVTMLVPPQPHGGPVLVRRKDHRAVSLKPGIREVPQSLIDEKGDYLKRCGVKPATADKT